MLLYKFEAAIPWQVALTLDESGKTLPTEGAPWRPSGSLQAEAGKTLWECPWMKFLAQSKARAISSSSRLHNEAHAERSEGMCGFPRGDLLLAVNT